MAANSADFTLTFRGLCDAAEHAGPERDTAVRRLFSEPAAFDAWTVRWRARLAAEERDPLERSAAMRQVNPAFIPRNHLVEEAIRAAVDAGDLGPFNELMTVWSSPYEDQPGFERHSAPPRSDQIVRQTFCGT
jgi:uncharacterized protein YdiU (UPF0061 family)